MSRKKRKDKKMNLNGDRKEKREREKRKIEEKKAKLLALIKTIRPHCDQTNRPGQSDEEVQ